MIDGRHISFRHFLDTSDVLSVPPSNAPWRIAYQLNAEETAAKQKDATLVCRGLSALMVVAQVGVHRVAHIPQVGAGVHDLSSLPGITVDFALALSRNCMTIFV